MKYLIALLSLFLLFTPVKSMAEKKHDVLKVVLFGDSLVSGYSVKKEFSFKRALENKLKSLGYSRATPSTGFFSPIDGATPS